MPADIKFKKLDHFLRKIWLECCGHLSAFTIGNIRYEQEIDDFESDTIYNSGQRIASMNIIIGTVLHPGLIFYYEYDFGTTTYLALKVLSEREEDIKHKSIQILARNVLPEKNCEICGEPATLVCSQCIFEDKGWLCKECAIQHQCKYERFLPVVNSPRVGMCGYTGK